MATITSHYARAALGGVRQQGKSVEPLLAQAGISAELLVAPAGRVYAEQMTRLIQGIWQALEDEFMGFTPHRCKPGSFAMMCQLVSRCETVDALFEQGIKFYGLITDDLHMQYRQLASSREFVVAMDQPELDSEHFLLEFWLVIWHRFCSWIVGKRINLLSVHFAYPEPTHSAEFTHQFSCPCYFNAEETRICFSDKFASLKPCCTPGELATFLKNSPADLLTIPGDDDSLVFKIKTALLRDMDGDNAFPEAKVVAESLFMSESTLRRKLKLEATSYQKVKDAVRCDLAIEKLYKQEMPVEAVAVLLGFSESRSFCRAFKHWTGVTPHAYQFCRK